jgi:hypothetical protein
MKFACELESPVTVDKTVFNNGRIEEDFRCHIGRSSAVRNQKSISRLPGGEAWRSESPMGWGDAPGRLFVMGPPTTSKLINQSSNEMQNVIHGQRDS